MNELWYDPKNNDQVMAVYRDCRYGGSVWQEAGYLPLFYNGDELKVTRNHRVSIHAYGFALEIEPSINPVQPVTKPPEPDPRDVKIAALETELAAMKARLDALDATTVKSR